MATGFLGQRRTPERAPCRLRAPVGKLGIQAASYGQAGRSTLSPFAQVEACACLFFPSMRSRVEGADQQVMWPARCVGGLSKLAALLYFAAVLRPPPSWHSQLGKSCGDGTGGRRRRRVHVRLVGGGTGTYRPCPCPATASGTRLGGWAMTDTGFVTAQSIHSSDRIAAQLAGINVPACGTRP